MKKDFVIKSFKTPGEAHAWAKKALGKKGYSLVDSQTLKSLASRSASSGRYHVIKAYNVTLGEIQEASNKMDVDANNARNEQSQSAIDRTKQREDGNHTVRPHSRVPVVDETTGKVIFPASTVVGNTNNEGLEVDNRRARLISPKVYIRGDELTKQQNLIGLPPESVGVVGQRKPPSSSRFQTQRSSDDTNKAIKSVVKSVILEMKRSGMLK